MVLNAVQVHNGTIEADSIPGSGTLFTIKLPLAPAETSLRKEESNDG
jgi:signal transduction histidine kinase